MSNFLTPGDVSGDTNLQTIEQSANGLSPADAMALAGRHTEARKLAAIQGGFISPTEAGFLGADAKSPSYSDMLVRNLRGA